MVPRQDLLKLAFCVCGVVGSLLVYGLLQERIMTLSYGSGDKREVFKFSLFLVACNRLAGASIAAGTLLAKGMRAELAPAAPIHCYASVSLSNVLATTCQYEALKHVSFAVQTLGKCAKMFPVMLWGLIILRNRYSAKDVAFAVAITGGAFAFVALGPTASRVAKGASSSLYGAGLMAGYLAADGFTSTFQQAMFKGYHMSSYNQVLYVSLCSFALSSFALATSGQVLATFRFLSDHPEALASILALSVAASCGSIFITYTIKTFGALAFAAIMTTRQLLSVVLSSVVFRSPLTAGQWLGLLVTVGSLYLQVLTRDPKPAGKGGGGGGVEGGGANEGKAKGGERGPLVGPGALRVASRLEDERDAATRTGAMQV